MSSNKSVSKENTPEKPSKPTKTDKKSKDDEAETSSLSNLTSVESLGKLLAEKLGFHSGGDDDVGDSGGAKVKVLNSVSIDGIVQYIKQKKCKNIITMAGAGISTSAGIPDFRSPGSGLYNNLEKYNLPYPQAIFELDYFNENPKPFFVLAKELYPGSFKPTISHYFIRLLMEKDLLLRHYTQNIDTLERIAGIPSEKLVEAHGTFFTGHCLQCHHEYTLDWMKERIFKDQIPECDNCQIGVVKPDIVFFGEALPERFHYLIQQDFAKCDLLIILGSSLVVQPFASLIDMIPETCPRLLINREKVGQRSNFMSMLGFSSGLDFDGKHNTRDVFWLGDCDDGCQLVADKLGWGDELKQLREKEIKKIEENEAKENSSSTVDENNDKRSESENCK